MEDLSPRVWPDTDTALRPFVPMDGGRDDATGAAVPGWLAALPHAAALARCRGGQVEFDHWNELFSAHHGTMLLSRGGCPDWASMVLSAIAAFAAGKDARRQFGFERPSCIGVEDFAVTLSRVAGHGAGKAGERILLSIVDRTTDRRMEDTLRRELLSDTLTTLPNRVGFVDQVERAMAAGAVGSGEMMVMVIDLNRFSRINESLGSLEGDQLLLTVANRLHGHFTDAIAVARLSGDEFALCCVLAQGVTGAIRIGEEVKAAIARPVRLGAYHIAVDCAIGCAIAAADHQDVDELVRRAQSAVRAAKRSDRLEIYRPGVIKAAQRRFQVESRLREALTTGAMQLAYQPLVDLTNGAITGFEALARWNDTELGIVSPVEFIQVAEESGLIVHLGRWALHEAMQQLARWDVVCDAPVPLRMSVNVSPIQMARDDVVSTVANALRMSGVDGRRLTIELTESAIVGDPANSGNLLAALKGFNVSIAMDDFGTGYSNLASLQSLPIDVLKIDRSFVTDMLVDRDKHAIARAIMSLAQALKLRTTAEGIENAELADALRKMGCNTGQGYHFARPMTADAALDYWRARNVAATT